MLLPQKSGLALLLCLLPLAAPAADAVAVRSVSVSAQAEMRLPPDQVTVDVTLTETSPQLADAQKKTNKQLAALKDIAKQFGIPAGKVQTTSSSTQPDYRYEPKTNKRIFQGYTVTHRIALTLEKLDDLGTLIAKLTDAGINQIDSVRYGLKSEDEATNQALKQAVAKARAKAGLVAQSLGETLGPVISINEGGSSYTPLPPVPMMRKANFEGVAMAAPSADLPAGESTVTSSVTATFALQPK